jgi:hypothetical protein
MVEMVEVNKPGSPFHNRRGAVIESLSGNRYTVEFFDSGRYIIETFDGRNLKALITV